MLGAQCGGGGSSRREKRPPASRPGRLHFLIATLPATLNPCGDDDDRFSQLDDVVCVCRWLIGRQKEAGEVEISCSRAVSLMSIDVPIPLWSSSLGFGRLRSTTADLPPFRCPEVV